ncbi:hypothetical protein IOD16_18095 [Saccharothrix sp. 6-C]|uniref:Wadjet anti-phage system protein JetD domain-containing protein n=1 Tax=Saccharothrix sp. 6-C TaxID=2781735 RepID=UPI001917375C|nr:Wadjet anti-phage system protein JetD domain-containing protein [Saccharothrix sp. 6-C]QQQ80123.1 hypothetical protein IOD16_18095 [Saccharothrix sp. 6-C]
MNPEKAIADAIALAVEKSRIRRVPLQAILVAAASVDRTAAATVGWRSRVLTALATLAAEGRVELPRTKLDRSAHPPLPLYVTRPAPLRPERTPRPPVVWHAELAWAALLFDEDLLSPAELSFLEAVNNWLPKRRAVRVPVRERSLEVLGDEKELEAWMLGPLFSPGRLTLGLLETYACWPPVEQTTLGDRSWLVIENYTTYRSISDRAEQLGFDGRVVWGSGNQVGTRLAALSTMAPAPTACWYFGDIDTGGLRVAKLAESRAAELALPPVIPARGLYRLLLHHGASRPSNTALPTAALVAWARAWFDEPLGEAATSAVADGKRLVQEYVGVEVLSGTTLADWFDEPESLT